MSININSPNDVSPCNDTTNTTRILLNEASTPLSNYFTIDEFNKNMSNTRNFTIFSYNINSLRKHIDNFMAFINSLKLTPDVIVLSEIRNDVNEILNHNFRDYNYYIHYPQSRCGGIAILIKSTFEHDDFDCIKINTPDVENKVIKVKVGNTITYISGIYKHPKKDITEFSSLLVKQIKSVPRNSDLIIVGDINIDLLKADTNANIKNYLCKIKALNLTQVIDLATRITNNTQSIIDHCYIRNSNKLIFSKSGIFINKISDHLCTFLTLKLKPDFDYKTRQEIRILNRKNIQTFKSSLSNLNVTLDIENGNTSESNWEKFTEVFKSKFESAFPIQKISRKAVKNKSWFTDSIKRHIKIREKLYNTWKENRSPYNERQFKNYRNKVNNMIKKAKKDFYTKMFNGDKDNKKTWEEINTIIGKNKAKSSIETLNVNGIEISDQKEIVDALNNHFSSIGENMCNNFENNEHFKIYMPPSLNKSILLRKITEEDINKIFDSLSNKNSKGLDYSSHKLVKLVKAEIVPILTRLINQSIADKVYPKCLKIAKIVPLFKSGKKNDVNNYRPISLLSTFNKIFECVLHKTITSFIENNNILFQNQFGFRKYHSTIDALIKTHDYIIHEIRNKKKVIGIFIDLKKAFDSIDTNILIEKLKFYGIEGPFNDIIKSYLTNRECITVVGGNASNIKPIKYGVPQGSVLGPLLFALYINDIKSLSNEIEINLFADDTNIFCSDVNYPSLVNKCNIALEQCYKWMIANKLTINTDKTHFLDFSKQNKTRSYDIQTNLKLGGKILTEKIETKYLGLIFQNDLKWDKHVSSVIKKLNSKIPFYYLMREILPKNKRKLIFNSFSTPIINYGIEIYGKTTELWSKQLQKTQNRILKILFNYDKITSTNFIHKANDILKVKDHENLRLLLIGHKKIHYPTTSNIAHDNLIVNNHSGRSLRHEKTFTITTNHFETKNKVIERIAVLWNRIPNQVKEIKDRNKFKSTVKKITIENYT